MVYWYLFATILAAVACVLCTSQALKMWTEGGDMNWGLLILGILNGIFFIIDSCTLITALQNG